MTEPPGQPSRLLRLSLPCVLTAVREAARTAHDFLAEAGCSEEDIIDCELALVEACNNAIKYARETARELPVRLDLECSPTEVDISVTDHTPGFDWPAQVTPPGLESESGRGVFLIKSVMDDSEYRRGDTENVLLLRRRRSGARHVG